MIKLLSVTLLSITTLVARAQETPWAYDENNQKIYFKAAPGCLLVKFKKQRPAIPFVHRLTATGIRKTEDLGNGLQKVYIDAPAANVLSEIRKDTNIIYSWEALYVDDQPFLPTGEVILMPKEGVSTKNVLRTSGLLDKVDITTSSRKLFGPFEVLRVKNDADLFDIANKLQETGQFICAAPDNWAKIDFGTNDPLYPFQEWLNHPTNTNLDINVEETWAMPTSNLISIVVIDDGLAPHEDLPAYASGWAPRNPTGHGLPATVFHGHGTSVAGIIAAAANNNLGIAGGFQGSHIIRGINIFWDNNETQSDIASTFAYAVQNMGADVINCSWSYAVNYAPILAANINAAQSSGRSGKGAIIIAASGNSALTSNAIRWPGRDPQVITVGAVDHYGVRSDYSCYGADLDIMGRANYGDIVTTDLMGAAGYSPDNYTATFDGTSAAAPQVAAIAAKLVSLNQNLTYIQVHDLIRNNGNDLGPAGFDSQYGGGMANGCKALAAAVQQYAYITGPNALTLGQLAWYDLADYTYGAPATFTWSTSTPSILSLTPTGNSCWVTKTAAGTGSLTVQIQSICGTTITKTKSISSAASRMAAPEITLSPNPAATTVNVSYKADAAEQILEYTITRKTGEVVQRKKVTPGRSFTADIAALPTDVYLVNIRTSNGWKPGVQLIKR
ncbi:S8 family peptidase [Chitinophaga horti]|uniref:S8 family peptidase n=1 Tax=Chitinophaga horti TaxID=2920382 RepID=A0ABY6IX32_9BACT|nr:S8 family peptidase [Chitinophaga horti]UYQ91939.1 S8 family peptidase [Chitinophaga horti]